MNGGEPEFIRLLEALEPYLQELVFAGGWAHRLHTLHPLAAQTPYGPLLTRDADLIPGDSLRRRAVNLGLRLKSAGFTEELRSDDHPPVVHYSLGEESEGFYAEFITPLRGGASRRDGSPDDTESVAGVSAQKLRHVELLLHEPWVVSVDREHGFPTDKTFEVSVANPASFVVQKLAIANRRIPEKQPKDVLYVHDTLIRFGDALEALAPTARHLVTMLSPKEATQLRKNRERYFGGGGDDAIAVLKAADIAKSVGRADARADRIAMVLRSGLARLLDVGPQ